LEHSLVTSFQCRIVSRGHGAPLLNKRSKRKDIKSCLFAGTLSKVQSASRPHPQGAGAGGRDELHATQRRRQHRIQARLIYSAVCSRNPASVDVVAVSASSRRAKACRPSGVRADHLLLEGYFLS